MNDGSANQGRLYYQTPVLQVMGRELASFTDLQKTLSQLGFNSGSALFRLNYRTTDTPLEEAMGQMEEYFKSVEPQPKEESRSSDPTNTSMLDAQSPDETSIISDNSVVGSLSTSTPNPDIETSRTEPMGQVSSGETESTADPANEQPMTSPSTGRPLQIFAPPSATVPTAARQAYNPMDYTPSVEHAQTHQRMLSESSRNRQLPSEAQLATQAEQEREKLAAVNDVEIKIRFPDESSLTARFRQSDTGAGLYDFVRECLDERLVSEGFVLRNPGMRGKGEIIPDSAARRLIQDLGLRGRVLTIFGWDEKKSSLQAKGTKEVLKENLRAQAKELKVEDIKNADGAEEDGGIRVNLLKENQEDADKGKKKGGMPKWMNKLSKK